MDNKKRNRKKGKKNILLSWIIGITAIIVIIGVVLFFYVTKSIGGDKDVRIYLYDDTTEDNLGEKLAAYLPEGYVSSVMLSYKLLGGAKDGISPEGSYVVTPRLTAVKFANNLRNGRQTPVKLTLSYARTFGDIAGKISGQMEFDSLRFVTVTDSVLPAKGFKKEQFTSYFLPDTYEFYWTASPEKVLESFGDNYDRFWTSERREKASNEGLSPLEVSTLASIVESETSKEDEKPLVARLYLNRLKKGMKLQADPTVIFATGDFSIRRVTGEHLRNNSPYNTYRFKGLPPGPIKMPSKAGLDAVLNAPRHDYLYMCAKEDFSGYHNFSADYSLHQANGQRYRQELDRRNIK